MIKTAVLLVATVALAAAAPANIFEIDISPEEAQRYLASPPFTEPQLSSKTAVLPLVRWNDPRFRSAEAGPTLGHYWKNGREIENTEDYVEEVYDASQFHGQDGLGAYKYGYEAPESAKVENRVHSGDVTGSYVYQSGNDLIKVRYWADSQGFHQEDNVPRSLPQETPEVQAARLEHERAWQEAAAAARNSPDPHGDYSAAKYEGPNYDNHNTQYNTAASQQQVAVVPREGKQYYPTPAPQYRTTTEPEPTGPPRGFFYSFNYPVSIIVPKNAQNGAGGVQQHGVGVHSA